MCRIVIVKHAEYAAKLNRSALFNRKRIDCLLEKIDLPDHPTREPRYHTGPTASNFSRIPVLFPI